MEKRESRSGRKLSRAEGSERDCFFGVAIDHLEQQRDVRMTTTGRNVRAGQVAGEDLRDSEKKGNSESSVEGPCRARYDFSVLRMQRERAHSDWNSFLVKL